MRPAIFLPTITSSSPGWKFRPSTTLMPPRTSKAAGMTARNVTFVGPPWLTLGKLITTTQSHAAMGVPSARLAMRSSATIMLRTSMPTPEVSSEADPRCTMIALSSRPVERSAAWKPADIESRMAKTATTSEIPEIASSVTCQRTRTFRML